MLDIEYRILQKIWASDSHRCAWIDVLNAFDPQTSCNGVHSILCCLIEAKLVYSDKPPMDFGLVSLTDEGYLALLSESERRQAESNVELSKKEDRDYRIRKEKREILTLCLSVFSVVIAVCALIVSIIHP